MENNMHRKPGLSRSEIHARDLIQTAIGRILAAQYDLAEPLPERLVTLLRCFEETDVIGADETPLVGCSSSRNTSRRAPRRASAKPEPASA
jgi:hypothetical protein